MADDDDLTPNELAFALIQEMQRINENLESLTNAVYSLPEQLTNILEIKEGTTENAKRTT